jgi:epoxyqueuosine reductase
MRNVLIAAGNANAPELLPLVERHFDSESPLIRAMAVWAFGELAPKDHVHEVAAARQPDHDPCVATEWAMIRDKEA